MHVRTYINIYLVKLIARTVAEVEKIQNEIDGEYEDDKERSTTKND
jgi:hypothetical protein